MFRPDQDGQKRADFLVNITNDGWFWANENADHLQAAAFRSIENRVWSARSVNTGISGFIDSVGRYHDLLPVRTEGVSTSAIMIDSRLSFYTRYGDLFAFACVGGTILLSGWAWWTRKKPTKQEVAS
jgi:apolipoprotein N-acyltransferase